MALECLDRRPLALEQRGGGLDVVGVDRRGADGLALQLLDLGGDLVAVRLGPAGQQHLAEHVRGLRALVGDDAADTAALVAQLDLVIAVDTSVAHLAAAMGRPTWILLPVGD